MFKPCLCTRFIAHEQNGMWKNQRMGALKEILEVKSKSYRRVSIIYAIRLPAP